ncbi:hypothetical protein MTO96_034935 [Rhipicephalus appendiculatus]
MRTIEPLTIFFNRTFLINGQRHSMQLQGDFDLRHTDTMDVRTLGMQALARETMIYLAPNLSCGVMKVGPVGREANCGIAVKVLTERFGRKDLLIDDPIDSLLAIEPIETSSQVSRLRGVVRAYTVQDGCSEILGMPSLEYAFVLPRVLMRSWPEDLAIQHQERTKIDTQAPDSAVQSTDAQVKAVLKFLQVEVESRDESQALRETRFMETVNEPQGCGHRDATLSTVRPSTDSMVMSPSANSRPRQRNCPPLWHLRTRDA